MKIYYLNTKILDILVDDTSVRYRSIMGDRVRIEKGTLKIVSNEKE